MSQLEVLLKKLMLYLGILGVVIIYSGFLYLFFTGDSSHLLPWYLLISPWICVYYGLSSEQQQETLSGLKSRFKWKIK